MSAGERGCDEDVNDSPESTLVRECGRRASLFYLEADGTPSCARCALHPVRELHKILGGAAKVSRAEWEVALVMSA